MSAVAWQFAESESRPLVELCLDGQSTLARVVSLKFVRFCLPMQTRSLVGFTCLAVSQSDEHLRRQRHGRSAVPGSARSGQFHSTAPNASLGNEACDVDGVRFADRRNELQSSTVLSRPRPASEIDSEKTKA